MDVLFYEEQDGRKEQHFTHPSISLLPYPIGVRSDAGAYLQLSTGRRWGTPWTGRQSITGNILYASLIKKDVLIQTEGKS